MAIAILIYTPMAMQYKYVEEDKGKEKLSVDENTSSSSSSSSDDEETEKSSQGKENKGFSEWGWHCDCKSFESF